MKTMFSKLVMGVFTLIVMGVFTLIVMAVMFNIPAFAQIQRFEDQSLEITSKLPPQYLGWKVEQGSTTQTEPMYYKVTAYIPGIGETKISPVTTAYTTYTGLCSTNSLRLMWARVNGATYYKLYRSADNTSFYYITSPTVLTYVDEGIANGAAFAAASPRGGDLAVENKATAGSLYLTGSKTLAQMNTYAPTGAGEIWRISDATLTPLCISSGAAAGAFTTISSTFTHCQ